MLLLVAAVVATGPAVAATPCPDTSALLATARRVADWQLAHPRHPPLDWANAAFYAGLVELALVDEHADYRERLTVLGRTHAWRLGPRPYHADDHAVGQCWLALAEASDDDAMSAPTRSAMDAVLAADHRGSLTFTGHQAVRWNWCDALFMAPPVLARLARMTGDGRYLDFMDREWRATTDALRDETTGLYLRDSRYVERRDAGGRAVFWGRGNGWVIAGLVRVLRELPVEDPRRPYYHELLRGMAATLLPAQQADGRWRADLLAPERTPVGESSATAFIAYGLCAATNQGLLATETTLPAVCRAYRALLASTSDAGRLGWVQAIGYEPRATTAESWETYGSGAWLLLLVELTRCDRAALEAAWERSR